MHSKCQLLAFPLFYYLLFVFTCVQKAGVAHSKFLEVAGSLGVLVALVCPSLSLLYLQWHPKPRNVSAFFPLILSPPVLGLSIYLGIAFLMKGQLDLHFRSVISCFGKSVFCLSLSSLPCYVWIQDLIDLASMFCCQYFKVIIIPFHGR